MGGCFVVLSTTVRELFSHYVCHLDEDLYNNVDIVSSSSTISVIF